MSLIRVTFGINILVFFSIFLIKIIARLYENYECSLTSNCLQKITFNSFINDLIFRIPSPDKRGKEEVKHAQKSYNQTLQASLCVRSNQRVKSKGKIFGTPFFLSHKQFVIELTMFCTVIALFCIGVT